MVIKLYKKTLFLVIVLVFTTTSISSAQQTIEFFNQSSPSTNLGPSASSAYTFRLNTNNPTGDENEQFLPSLTATVSFGNFENYDVNISQNTDGSTDGVGQNEPSITSGWLFTGGSGSIRSGTEVELMRTFENGVSTTSTADDPAATLFESGDSNDQGINPAQNTAIQIAASFEVLRNQTYRPANTSSDAPRYRLGDMTVLFNQRVNNPVFHLIGLGGEWIRNNHDGQAVADFKNYGTIEMELTSEDALTAITLSKKAGTSFFEVVDGGGTGTDLIRNNADRPNFATNTALGTGVGTGSVLFEGDGIKSLTFTLYARGIEDPDDANTADTNFIVGDEGWGWAGGGSTDALGGTLTDLPDINFSGDAFLMSISAQAENTELTGDSCYRMLSSPTSGTTYAQLLDPLWTQVANSSFADYSDPAADPNVWLWPDITGDSNTGTAGVETWIPISDTQFESEVPAGTGFLVSVFTDDEFGTAGSFPKNIAATGTENSPLTVTNANGMNSNNDGWTLLGNPFKSPIQVADGSGNGLFEGTTTGVNTSVYIWDRNTEAGLGGDDNDGITGSWRTGNATGGGDLTNDAIAPFQGFFVQNTSTGGGSSQVQFRDANKTTGGAFYGKENGSVSQARFEVNGEGLFNSMWLQFSDEGSYERELNDALELMPFTSEFATLGSKKIDDTIFDIGHFPIPEEEIEIPVSFETTRSGLYTFTASDLDISFGQDLYLIDLNEEKSIRIDENLEYSFTVSNAAKVNASLRPCNMESGPQKATTFTAADRFLITSQPKEFGSELPTDVALKQNYPNPFNPTTQITYQLPQQSDVRLQVFDMAGRQVATLVNESVNAGTHTVNFDASSLSSGVYLYKLQAGSTVLTRKLTLIK